jgi:uncharacterized membrane protein
MVPKTGPRSVLTQPTTIISLLLLLLLLFVLLPQESEVSEKVCLMYMIRGRIYIRLERRVDATAHRHHCERGLG